MSPCPLMIQSGHCGLIRIEVQNMPVIKAGAFDLDYSDTGSGPAVVLVHSSASGHRQWQRLVEALQSRYRLIAVNLFGYGKTSSWPGTRPLTTADQAELVAAAAELAPEPVALIGHSLGGAVAFEAAAKLSGRVRVLVAFEPILFGHLKAHGPVNAYDEIAGVASRYNELARTGRLERGRRMVRRLLDYCRHLGGHAGRAQAEHVRNAAGGGARVGHGNDRYSAA